MRKVKNLECNNYSACMKLGAPFKGQVKIERLIACVNEFMP